MKKKCVLFILVLFFLIPRLTFAKTNSNFTVRKIYGQKRYHETNIDLKKYKKSHFYHKYQDAQKRIAQKCQKLRKEYLREKNPKKQREIVKQSAILFVEGFNKLFKFWEGMGYDYNFGNSYYPQFWKVACGTFVHRILEDMGMQIQTFVKTEADIGFDKDEKVYIWRGWPKEQIPHYGQTMKIYHPKSDQNPFISSNDEFPFFSIAGYTWHVFIVAENPEKEITMFDALGSVQQKPFGKQIQKVFYTKWEYEDFKQWLLTAHIKLRR